MDTLFNPITGETVEVSKSLLSFSAKANKFGAAAKTRGQFVGRKVADGWNAAAREGDATLGALGVNTRTAAYTVGGVGGLAAGNNAGNLRAKRRESVGKSVSPMFGAKDAFANQPTRKVGALLPTGKHVSHENDLHVTRKGKRKSVGRFGDTKLQQFGKADLSRQPGMINPGVQTSSWSHGTPNQNFAASQGRRGQKIS